MFASGDIWNEKTDFIIFLAKKRQNTETILKTCELFIYTDVCYIPNAFCN